MTLPRRPTDSDTDFDLLVVGSGQGGGPLARSFARAGYRTALVESTHVGGSCVNEGCTPTKTVIASARVAYLARRAADYGVGVGGAGVVADMERVHQRKQQIVDSFRDGGERSLGSAGVELIRGHARFVGPRTVAVTPTASDHDHAPVRTITAGTVVINTGLRPAIPDLPGLDTVPYLTSMSMLELTTLPEHLVVLGGGYVGVEFAQAFRRFGSRVTLVQRSPRLLPREDADVSDAVRDILREDGVDVVLSARTIRVDATDGGGFTLTMRSADGQGGERALRGSHLLVAVGRVPNTDDMGLDRTGVEVDDHGFVRVDERLATGAPGVYAIGDVKGGPAFTHISYDDFRILRTNLLEGGSASTAGRMVPYTVFMDPELGAIGMTEDEARAAGRTIRVARLPMTKVARALEVDESRGFMKAVVDAASGQLLGARVLGIEGGETVALFQVAMMGGLPYTALRDGVFSHPTLAESVNNLFTSMDRDQRNQDADVRQAGGGEGESG